MSVKTIVYVKEKVSFAFSAIKMSPILRPIIHTMKKPVINNITNLTIICAWNYLQHHACMVTWVGSKWQKMWAQLGLESTFCF